MFSLQVIETANERFDLDKILLNLSEQKVNLLDNRIEIEPHLYDAYLNQREISHKKAPRESKFNISTLYSGTWGFKNIDEKYRRFYDRFSNNESYDKEKVRQYLNEKLSDTTL